MIPIGTAMTMATMSVSTASDSVGSMRWTMSSVTGSPVNMDVPRF
jgi:hypothetical protein